MIASLVAIVLSSVLLWFFWRKLSDIHEEAANAARNARRANDRLESRERYLDEAMRNLVNLEKATVARIEKEQRVKLAEERKRQRQKAKKLRVATEAQEEADEEEPKQRRGGRA